MTSKEEMHGADRAIHWILRVAAAACFVGHGAFGFITKEAWIPFFAAFGLSRDFGYQMMPVIGAVDITVGLLVLFQPRKIFLLHMAFWAVFTSLLRPIAGLSFWESFERGGNYGAPIGLLLIAGSIGWFRSFGPRSINEKERFWLMTALQITTAFLLIGHGGYQMVLVKSMLVHHWESLGLPLTHQAWIVAVRLFGFLEILLGLSVLFRPVASVCLFVCLWKVFTELLYPISGDYFFEFVERAGSYGVPLALFVLLRTKRSWSAEDFWPCRFLSSIDVDLQRAPKRILGWVASLSFIIVWFFGIVSVPGAVRYSHDDPLGIVYPKTVSYMPGGELLDRLRDGGLVIYVRHMHTTLKNSVDDTRQWEHGHLELEDFADCSWQRPLGDFGRENARIMGLSFRNLGVPIGKVISSPYCRCVDTAALISGKEPEQHLGLIYRRKEYTRERMETYTHNLLATVEVSPGTNTLIAGHRTPMEFLNGFPEGEAAIFEQDGAGSYTLIGKIGNHEWNSALEHPHLLGYEAHSGYFPIYR